MAKRGGRSRHDDNRTGKICIGIILIVFMAVMSVQIYKVYQKNLEMIAREAELNEQYEEELARQEELKEYEQYVQSQDYVEDVAETKLGLLYENQIIFRKTTD